MLGAFVLANLSPCNLPASTDPSLDPSSVCDRAAVYAAKATGVPISVLKAISLTETGQSISGTFKPWPWTVNMEGKGSWFSSEGEAKEYVFEKFEHGAISFDVGCFQINYKWHHEAFESLEQMFEPRANALYAAEFLQGLYSELGSWEKAAGAYHSRNPHLASKYESRFKKFRAWFVEEDSIPLPELPELLLASSTGIADAELSREIIRLNTYPLLQGEPGGHLGSLMPSGVLSGRNLSSNTGSARSPILMPLNYDSTSSTSAYLTMTEDQAALPSAVREGQEVLESKTDIPFVGLGAIY